MSPARPPLPPRRKIPPLPPTLSAVVPVEDVTQFSTAARMGQVDRKWPQGPDSVANADNARKDKSPEPPVRQPPPVPPKWTRPSPEQLARALARRPPPPPVKGLPTPQSRHAPPISPTRLPTPPPDPEPPFKPANEASLNIQDNEPSHCLECRDFSQVDAHAALFPRHTVSSLINLAYDLTEPFPYEVDKARAIFTWLHHNIAYDTESFFSGDIHASTPELTLSSGLAVCDGYAGLFKHLAEIVGIQAHKVTGHGKGVGYEATSLHQPVPPYSSGHAWNCVLLDNEWRLIDACWGAGALEGQAYHKRFAPMWFTSTPAEFIQTHFPGENSYQLLSAEVGVVSWRDYIMEPVRPIIFVDFYQLDLWPIALQPAFRSVKGNKQINFRVHKRCEHMSTAETDNFVFMLSFGNERVPLELDDQGGWSANVFIPSGAGEVSLFYVRTVNGAEARGFGIQKLKNALGRQAMSFGGLAKWTLI